MNREETEKYITKTYGIHGEFPWIKLNNHEVFRHIENKKWFALIMNIPKNRLGVCDKGTFDIINLKCDPIAVGSLRSEHGFFPAYHMNKEKWISVALDGSVPDEKLKMLIDISFDLTKSKRSASTI